MPPRERQRTASHSHACVRARAPTKMNRTHIETHTRQPRSESKSGAYKSLVLPGPGRFEWFCAIFCCTVASTCGNGEFPIRAINVNTGITNKHMLSSESQKTPNEIMCICKLTYFRRMSRIDMRQNYNLGCNTNSSVSI